MQQEVGSPWQGSLSLTVSQSTRRFYSNSEIYPQADCFLPSFLFTLCPHSPSFLTRITVFSSRVSLLLPLWSSWPSNKEGIILSKFKFPILLVQSSPCSGPQGPTRWHFPTSPPPPPTFPFTRPAARPGSRPLPAPTSHLLLAGPWPWPFPLPGTCCPHSVQGYSGVTSQRGHPTHSDLRLPACPSNPFYQAQFFPIKYLLKYNFLLYFLLISGSPNCRVNSSRAQILSHARRLCPVPRTEPGTWQAPTETSRVNEQVNEWGRAPEGSLEEEEQTGQIHDESENSENTSIVLPRSSGVRQL